MQSIDSEAESLVDTKELLEFIDTMDVRDASKVDESDTQEESVHDVTGQDDVDPRSGSQFSSFMSYHEGESSSLDPGTNGKVLSKSPIEESTKRHDSGVVDQRDINTHDSDVIAYESNNTSIPSVDISDHSNVESQSEEMTENTSVNPTVEVEVEPVRRSATLEWLVATDKICLSHISKSNFSSYHLQRNIQTLGCWHEYTHPQLNLAK